MLQFHMLSDADAAPEKWQGTALSALLGGADYPADRLSCGCTVIAMYDSTLPAGLLCVSGDTTDSTPVCGIVETVVLLPEYRRHGLGRILMGLAAGEALDRQIWFLAGAVPQTAEAEGFADGIHMKQTEWFADLRVLDLSDVEGLRYGK